MTLIALVAFVIGSYTLACAAVDRHWLWAIGCACVCVTALYALAAPY